MVRLDDAGATLDAAMKTGDPDRIAKASEAWKSIAEGEKTVFETTQLKRSSKSEWAKFWIPTIATIASSVALVATLIFQVSEFKANAQSQRDTDEDTSYRAALAILSDPNHAKATVVGIPMIKTFLTSQRLGGQARDVASTFSIGITDYRTFESLFNSIVASTTTDNYRDLVNICSGLDDQFNSYQDQINAATEQAKSTSSVSGMKYYLTVAKDTKNTQDQINAEIYLSERALQAFIRQHDKDIKRFDLSEGYLAYVDLSNVDLDSADFRSASFYSDDLRGANLANVISFDFSSWDNTAWWHARIISKPLLTYLEHKKPFSPQAKYQDITSKRDYWSNVRRLDGVN